MQRFSLRGGISKSDRPRDISGNTMAASCKKASKPAKTVNDTSDNGNAIEEGPHRKFFFFKIPNNQWYGKNERPIENKACSEVPLHSFKGAKIVGRVFQIKEKLTSNKGRNNDQNGKILNFIFFNFKLGFHGMRHVEVAKCSSQHDHKPIGMDSEIADFE